MQAVRGIAASDTDAVIGDVRISARHDQPEMVRAAEPQGPRTAPCDIGPALRQAGSWGDAPLDIEVPPPRFGEAVESAAAGDRSDAKITVKQIQLSVCDIHAEWELQP